MKRYLAFLFLIPLIFAPSCSSGPAPLESPLKSKAEILAGIPDVESLIAEKMNKTNILSVSVAVFTDGEIVYSKAFGYQDVPRSIPSDTDTVFQAASISKTVTAYITMMCVEKGLLELDKPAITYLDGYLPQDLPNRDKITVRMLMNHTSGMKNAPNGDDLSLLFEPGTRFSYSGGGIRYLQRILEAITGTPFEILADTKVFRPLHMDASAFVFMNAFTGHEQQAQVEENNIKYVMKDGFTEANAAYSLVSTPSDLGKLFMEYCKPTLISQSTADQMFSRSVKVSGHIWWGLGIGLQAAKTGDYIWHWGNNAGVYNSLAVADKSSGTGVIIMASGQGSESILREIASAAIGGIHYGYWNEL